MGFHRLVAFSFLLILANSRRLSIYVSPELRPSGVPYELLEESCLSREASEYDEEFLLHALGRISEVIDTGTTILTARTVSTIDALSTDLKLSIPQISCKVLEQLRLNSFKDTFEWMVAHGYSIAFQVMNRATTFLEKVDVGLNETIHGNPAFCRREKWFKNFMAHLMNFPEMRCMEISIIEEDVKIRLLSLRFAAQDIQTMIAKIKIGFFYDYRSVGETLGILSDFHRHRTSAEKAVELLASMFSGWRTPVEKYSDVFKLLNRYVPELTGETHVSSLLRGFDLFEADDN